MPEYNKISASQLLVGAALGLMMVGCQPSDRTEERTTTEFSDQQDQGAFENSLNEIGFQVNESAEQGFDVPVPVDSGGGYTHETHKANGRTIYQAGMLYQQTGNREYLDIAHDLLKEYAALYPTLDLHPKVKPSTPSRLFWQGLNEAWWLVHVAQGYDAIRDDLNADERVYVESNLFRPMADFLSEGSPQTFDRIHNHGTWAVAAVGLTGYALEDDEYVQKALYGLDKSGEAGFIRQIDMLFSPDGYYAEGPYYQRYAMMPFIVFANEIDRQEPDLNIFKYRDGVLLKGIEATLQQSYAGRYFPVNDAIREKGINTPEMHYGVAIAYDQTGDPRYLDIATQQSAIVPTKEGRKLAEAIDAGKAQSFEFKSMLLTDGPDGDRGGMAVLRSGRGEKDGAYVLKATSQGLGHGHFDRLSLLYFDNGEEVFADYGAARFLNLEPKNGGKYLPENQSWAKQTIAHNTLVIDGQSQFGGDWRFAEEYPSEVLAFKSGGNFQYMAGREANAYPDVSVNRLIVQVNLPDRPVAVDVVYALSDTAHQYDLPYHFKGQLITTNRDYRYNKDVLRPFGPQNGYQHLWHEAQSLPSIDKSSHSLVVSDRFYTLTTAYSVPTEAHMVRTGANDPNNNLRSERGLVYRANAQDISFASVMEKHGLYDHDLEVTNFTPSAIESLDVKNADGISLTEIKLTNGQTVLIAFAPESAADRSHTMKTPAGEMTWTGAVGVEINQ